MPAARIWYLESRPMVICPRERVHLVHEDRCRECRYYLGVEIGGGEVYVVCSWKEGDP